MRLILITIALLAFFSTAKAQKSDTLKELRADTLIFTAVEKDPTFKGGIDKFYQYLSQNLHYPASAIKNHIQGKVFITFVVERDGSLTDVKVVRGVSEDIDAEALRVIKNSPKWNPGTQNRRAVRVQYTMPLNFTLTGK
jgi:periplasmic protein TonB